MKFFFWNIRGFGQSDRKRQLKRFLRQSRFDVVGLQETIKVDFSDRELASLVEGLPFVWTWVSAVGHSGGILLGANSDTFEVGTIDKGEFFASIALHQ
jgi:exonuclease III